MLTIFYDGDCPLCHFEMAHLKQYDQDNQIELVDIQQSDFDKLYPEINYQEAMKVLHGVYLGEVLLGLDVTKRAWSLVGKGCWVAPLSWPVINPLSKWGYLRFAKYRLPISALAAKVFNLGSKNVTIPKCDTGTCYAKDVDNRR